MIRIFVFIFAASYFFSENSFAQTSHLKGMRRGTAAIVLAGLGGAVLGLSTLSFYKEPQGHIGNVTTGFGLGLVAGTIYVLSSTSGSAEFESTWEIPKADVQLSSRLQPARRVAEPALGQGILNFHF